MKEKPRLMGEDPLSFIGNKTNKINKANLSNKLDKESQPKVKKNTGHSDKVEIQNERELSQSSDSISTSQKLSGPRGKKVLTPGSRKNVSYILRPDQEEMVKYVAWEKRLKINVMARLIFDTYSGEKECPKCKHRWGAIKVRPIPEHRED